VIRAMIYLDPAQALGYFDRSLAGLRADDIVSLTETFKGQFQTFLKKAVESERAWARAGALRAIALLPDVEVAFLKEVAATSQYADVRRGALLRLEARGCADAMDAALAVVKDKDPEVRIAAIGTIERCGDSSTLDAIKAIVLEDREENVRVRAAAALLTYPKSAKKPAPKAPDKGKKGK
jgi:HEAT repeat protein